MKLAPDEEEDSYLIDTDSKPSTRWWVYRRHNQKQTELVMILESVKNLQIINSATGQTKVSQSHPTNSKVHIQNHGAHRKSGVLFQPFFQLNPALILQSVKLAALGSISQEPVRTIYVDYNHRPTKLHGTLIVNLVSKCRELNRANLLVSGKRKRCLLELDLQTFAKLKELSVEGDLESIRWKEYISSRSLPIWVFTK